MIHLGRNPRCTENTPIEEKSPLGSELCRISGTDRPCGRCCHPPRPSRKASAADTAARSDNTCGICPHQARSDIDRIGYDRRDRTRHMSNGTSIETTIVSYVCSKLAAPSSKLPFLLREMLIDHHVPSSLLFFQSPSQLPSQRRGCHA